MKDKTIEGFKFFHVANVFKSATERRVDKGKRLPKYKSEEVKWYTSMDLLYPEVFDAGQTCYLVYLDGDDTPSYVGEYSGLFNKRWLESKKFIWHSEHDNKLKIQLEAKRDISIWLCIDPFVTLEDGRRVNISRSIEQLIIGSLKPKWNKKGKQYDPNIGVPAIDIHNKYSKNRPLLQKDICSSFSEKGLDDYIEQLQCHNQKDWAELQNSKMKHMSRCRHFLNYVNSGVAPEDAKRYVWKEFPTTYG
jgi:hypothetical protein